MKKSLLFRMLGLIAAIGVSAITHAETPDPAVTGMLGTSSGEAIYEQICQGCHMAEGQGAVGAGHYPAFADNPTLLSANYMAATILNGRRNMPSFEHHAENEFFFPPTWLTDTQIANVINYIRSHFGNHNTDTISAADIAALHAQEPGK
ncbi:MAG TPA: cytochrome c [Dokdonella sp.]|uniref:c-type cytochrome n=1 Tax=Dokdonella sp. TaxID=2291710 RepID=UPI002D806318|nr:cytochrome c [Dokdonella sp.]HET9031900.1 cytochrome c [Dokdonella sp.]